MCSNRPAYTHWTAQPRTHTHTNTERGCFQARPGMKWKPCSSSWTSGPHAHLTLRLRQRQNTYQFNSLFLCLHHLSCAADEWGRGWAEDSRWTHILNLWLQGFTTSAYMCVWVWVCVCWHVCWHECLGGVQSAWNHIFYLADFSSDVTTMITVGSTVCPNQIKLCC